MKLRVGRLGVLAQLLLLIGVSLSAAALINYVSIVSRPPPEFPVYRISEIANVFRGRPLGLAGRGRLLLQWAGANQAAGAIRLARERAQSSNHGPEGRALLQRDPSLGAALATALEVSANDIDFYVRSRPSGRRHLLDDFMREGMSVEGERLVIGRFVVVFHTVGGGVAILHPDLRSHSRASWARQIAWVVLGGFLVMFPAAWLFAQRLTRPIRAFAASAERVGRDPSGAPVPTEGPAEIAAAAEALNLMQSRLRAFVSERLRIVAAVAHDLRTPLTRLSFLAEKAPPALRDSMRAEIREMSSMMDATVAFVRDATRPVARERIELRSLLETIADEASDLGEDVSLEPGPEVLTLGDAVALKRMIGNLVTNAQKYGGGAVLRLWREEHSARIVVDDHGPGLPDGELERVFEPFYRSEHSRSRETGGAGLGLSMVRDTARAHGGSAWLENRGDGGLRAHLVLPT